jgi:HAD superfamily hydrolase (TIGR01450 family)
MELRIEADVFLFDLDGTIYLGDKPIGNAIATLSALGEMGKQVYFLTNNSSRNKSEYIQKLTRMGYAAKEGQILTSAMAAIRYLQTRKPGKSVYPVGTPAFVQELKDNNILISEDGDIVLLGFDTTLTYEKIWRANILLEKGREFVVTHPDIVCPSDVGDMPDVGALLALLECSSGRAPSVICGKPYSPMAEIINDRVTCKKDKIVMVGDRLYTDILFGINNGYKSLLVLSGETTAEMLNDSGIKPDYVLSSVENIIVSGRKKTVTVPDLKF